MAEKVTSVPTRPAAHTRRAKRITDPRKIRRMLERFVKEGKGGTVENLAKKLGIQEETVVKHLSDIETQESVRRYIAAEVFLSVPKIIQNMIKLATKTEGNEESIRKAGLSLLELVGAKPGTGDMPERVRGGVSEISNAKLIELVADEDEPAGA